MPGTECIVEEIAYNDAKKDFEKAAGAAESINWTDLGFSVLAAYGGAVLGALTTKSPPGIAAGAAPGLTGFYRTIVKDIEEVPAANAAADDVEAASDALQTCREDHKNGDGDDPFADAPLPSIFDGMPFIPYADPDSDPDPDVSDDEIIIFDEDDIPVGETEDGDIIIIDDE